VLPVSFPPLPISKFGSNFLGHVTVIIFFPTNWEPIENLKGTCLFFDQKVLGKLWKLLFY
jgi:hypothetical protein